MLGWLPLSPREHYVVAFPKGHPDPPNMGDLDS
ncbi:hypothetical protein NOMA109596_04245 [Nocardioides marinus]|jgi:hypothetical protein